MGIRYLIPLLPFCYLLGGLALAALYRQPRWGRYAGAALCLWVGVAAAGIYPDHLSYFNEAACLLESPGRIGLDGGSRCGIDWLDDSNIDWGQGLKQLRGWLGGHANGRRVKLAYFGSYPPEGYLENFDKLQPADLFIGPSPGLFAVSSELVARLPAMNEAASWLRLTRPVAIVGHAFYIYDIR
jgi:hypothetical protein